MSKSTGVTRAELNEIVHEIVNAAIDRGVKVINDRIDYTLKNSDRIHEELKAANAATAKKCDEQDDRLDDHKSQLATHSAYWKVALIVIAPIAIAQFTQLVSTILPIAAAWIQGLRAMAGG